MSHLTNVQRFETSTPRTTPFSLPEQARWPSNEEVQVYRASAPTPPTEIQDVMVIWWQGSASSISIPATWSKKVSSVLGHYSLVTTVGVTTGAGSRLSNLIQRREVIRPPEVRQEENPTTEDSKHNMALLERAAETGDEDTFLKAMHQIDWSQRPAPDLVRAVHLAWAAGAHLAARKLATMGAQQHPDYPELHKMAHLLAPPRVKAHLPSVPSTRANQAWLRAHVDEYKGQWVALRDGALVAVAATVGELKAHIGSIDGIMLTRVF